MLSPTSFQRGRLEGLEEACWRFRSAAARKELMGARAERILVHLRRLEEELREAIWLPEHVPAALDTLRDSLEFLASRKRQGHPRDSLWRECSLVRMATLRTSTGHLDRLDAMANQGTKIVTAGVTIGEWKVAYEGVTIEKLSDY